MDKNLIGTYGVLIDPAVDYVDVVHFPNGIVRLRDLRSTLVCDWVEGLELSNGVDLWINEEGFIDGTAERVGTFRLLDADHEPFDGRASFFSGRGLLLTSFEGETCGWNEEDATKIKESIKVVFNELKW